MRFSRQSLAASLVEALLVAAGSAVVAVMVNALRSDGLPFVARTPYQTLVPCPEPGGPVTPLEPGDPAIWSSRTVILDARDSGAFATSHVEGALNVPYDYLDPVPDETLQEVARTVAASGASRVVVYGDGDRPDSGEQLGKELSGRGIKNVGFVRGGAPALLGRGAP